MILRPDEDRLLPRFLYYFLISPRGQSALLNASHGAVQLNIAPRHVVEKISTPLPTLQEQRAIVQALGALDDRITLLRETNKTLEAIAQAIFKSWFVDFDPVHAKMEGRHPEGMDEETAALFPDKFEESELGSIPRGWRAGTLEEIVNLNPESWTAKDHPETVSYIDLASVKENTLSSIKHLAYDSAPSRARRVLRKGDTIIGTVRPGNRSFAFIYDNIENLTGSTGFAVLRPRIVKAAEFVYLAATQNACIEYLTRLADGAAYPAVRPDAISGMDCIHPPMAILERFHESVAPLFAAIANNHDNSQTNAMLRDTLLPRLISGQLRLPEVRALIAEHA